MTTVAACPHVPTEIAAAHGDVCEGGCGSRTSLRLCAHCGNVGCCESQSSHGRDHALGAKHPVIRQLPLTDSSFTWCYTCDRYV